MKTSRNEDGASWSDCTKYRHRKLGGHEIRTRHSDTPHMHDQGALAKLYAMSRGLLKILGEVWKDSNEKCKNYMNNICPPPASYDLQHTFVLYSLQNLVLVNNVEFLVERWGGRTFCTMIINLFSSIKNKNFRNTSIMKNGRSFF